MRIILKYLFITFAFIVKHICYFLWYFKIKKLTWKQNYKELVEWYYEDRTDIYDDDYVL